LQLELCSRLRWRPFAGSILFGVSPHDPATYAAIAAMLIALLATAAACIPARRAARLNPVETLR